MDSDQQTLSPENTLPSESPSRHLERPVCPLLTVDVIVDMGAGLVALIERKSSPTGWALPGGFVEVGETLEEAALREVKEEIGLDVEIVRLFHAYSDPKRDERGHTVSVVYLARGRGQPKAATDAKAVELYHEMNLPSEIAFDHRTILRDYFMEHR